jgi:hypothetical protein
MTKLHTYTMQIWFLHSDDQKEFMEREIIAESDEKAEELAKLTRRNILNVSILKKEVYVPKAN